MVLFPILRQSYTGLILMASTFNLQGKSALLGLLTDDHVLSIMRGNAEVLVFPFMAVVQNNVFKIIWIFGCIKSQTIVHCRKYFILSIALRDKAYRLNDPNLV
jgi:hypothetical protein